MTAGFTVQAVLSSVSVHTEASVTSAPGTARVLSPGWDPPVRKVRVGVCVCVCVCVDLQNCPQKLNVMKYNSF